MTVTTDKVTGKGIKMAKKQNQQEGGLPAGLAQPAIRALTGAGYTRLEQLATVSEAEMQAGQGVTFSGW